MSEKLSLDYLSPKFESIYDSIFVANGDSLDILTSVKDESVDCVITDPPYFLDGMGNNWNTAELERKKNKAGVVGSLPVGMKFDPAQGLRLQEFMAKISVEVMRILKPGGFFLSFSQGRLYHRMAVAIEDAGFEIRDMCIWEREGQAKAFSQDHFVRKMKISEEEKAEIIKRLDGRKTPQLKGLSEPIVIAQKPKDGTFVENWMKYGVGLIDTSVSLDGKFPGTVMHVEKPKGKERREIDHMTVKPVVLIEHLIKLFSSTDAVICDPFLGSGTTAIACLKSGRKCIGIELDPHYYKEAFDRIVREGGEH